MDSGSLLISEVLATDAGKYECSAQSMAGSRTAPPVTLKVLAPPTVLRGPQDTEVIEGDGLDLPCEVSFDHHFSAAIDLRRYTHSISTSTASFQSEFQLTGDPLPMVEWHRENGNLPEGRSRILLDNTLRIEDTRPEDQGRYVCKGHNEGGNVTIAVKLHIYGKYIKCHATRNNKKC